MKHIFDKDFKYTPSDKTDIRKTFARIRREQQKKAESKPIPITTVKEKECHAVNPGKSFAPSLRRFTFPKILSSGRT